MGKNSEAEPACKCCGVAWREHLGAEGLCRVVQELRAENERLRLYEAELAECEKIAQQKHHMASVMGIGLLNTAQAIREICEQLPDAPAVVVAEELEGGA